MDLEEYIKYCFPFARIPWHVKYIIRNLENDAQKLNDSTAISSIWHEDEKAELVLEKDKRDPILNLANEAKPV